ncbi:uncharacterized protein LOC126969433 [Leptidea sinapis]|uniref:uncharacterized protein LOC126969433 n=1 Tax=Leptidea sinapis TaxID=189913 RepID=UPI0021C2DDEF|nr:uncharacterized protein LOC126969433 [Leptidea sinapis]
MAYPVKFLSLQKSELEYEVLIRGTSPASTVQELRKQICKLGPLFPSEDILESSLPISDDLKGATDVLAKIKSLLESPLDRNLLLRIENLLNHLYHRLNRITYDSKTQQLYDTCVNEFKTLFNFYNSVKDNGEDKLIVSSSKADSQQCASPLNVSVSCSRDLTNDVLKVKFDGKSCVRSFIERITELSKARDIPSAKLLSLATEIFTGDALHWFRSIRHNIASWEELILHLKADFDRVDYDYRLLAEIRARTQGETENIIVYLSIMSGLFSRLTKNLSDEDKLEIILHNIRPCYAATLSSHPHIKDLDTLKSLCRNYENVQARLLNFREPPTQTSDTIAPDFAYVRPSQNFKTNFQQYKFNNNQNTNNNSSFKNQTNHIIKTNESKINKSYIANNNNVHAIQTSSSKTFYCPRCRNNTHNLRQCKADKNKILCFICGHDGFKTPDCPNCNKEKLNSSKN